MKEKLDREEVLRSLRAFQTSIGYEFVKDLVTEHLKEKAREMGDLLRQSDKKNDYMIYRLSGYLDGFENAADLIDSSINEINKPKKEDEKPIY